MTQFGRPLHALNIDIICANSSQAKGRVAIFWPREAAQPLDRPEKTTETQREFHRPRAAAGECDHQRQSQQRHSGQSN
jgi:hypothetical protein